MEIPKKMNRYPNIQKPNIQKMRLLNVVLTRTIEN